MVNQVNGLFKTKSGKIKEYIFKIRSLEMEIGFPISYFYIPREKNFVADNLVNSVAWRHPEHFDVIASESEAISV